VGELSAGGDDSVASVAVIAGGVLVGMKAVWVASGADAVGEAGGTGTGPQAATKAISSKENKQANILGFIIFPLETDSKKSSKW
jgi:hypothetical protein